jgi:spectrin beta
MEVEDLFKDLADGKKLLKLLEIISGEKPGEPNNGKMRVHKLENVNKSLAFLRAKASHLTACLLACFEGITLALLRFRSSGI